MNDKSKNLLSLLGRVALSVALLAYLFTKIDVEKTWGVVKSAIPLYIFYAFLTFVLINLVLVGRWFIYILALDLKVPFKVVLRYFFVGLFGNLFLPTAIGGDVIKTIGLYRYSPEKSKVVASVLLDRLSGFAGMVVVAVVALVVGLPFLRDATLASVVLAMAIFSCVIGVVLFNEKWYSFGCQIFARWPKLKNGLMNIHYDVALLKDRRCALYQAVGASCLAQLISAGTFYYLAKALHLDARFIHMLIFVPLVCIAASFPSIGGLGVREAGVAYLFAKIGVDSGLAVSISLITFVFMVLAGLAGGLVFAFTKAPKKEIPCPDGEEGVAV